MNTLSELSLESRFILYALLAAMALFSLLVLWAQVNIIRGRPFPNPDGTKDDWREQKIFYGIAWADILVAIPITIAALVLVFTAPPRGLYAMGLVAFWFLWSNMMTTVTSLRFARPRITLQWIVVFPLGAVLGLAFLVWMLVHFETIYLN